MQKSSEEMRSSRLAIAFVSAITAPFEAEYGVSPFGRSAEI